MQLDGHEIAKKIYDDLLQRVGELQKKKIMPHLVVILVGKNPASIAYVTLKQKKGDEIGAKVTILRYDTTITTQELEEKVKLLNEDPYVHGILIQRPLPDHIDEKKLELITDPEKDIDGFHPKSPYTLPLPLAVGKILEEVFISTTAQGVARVGDPHRAPAANARTSDGGNPRQDPVSFSEWLQSKNIILLGKGPTGGGPILEHFKTRNITPTLIDSKTKNPEKVMKQADIIISAVGRDKIIKPENIKKDTILISVGIFRNEDNKLSGDYDVEAIKDIASHYTPTPGGVGPVNVAMLFDNLLTATEKQTLP